MGSRAEEWWWVRRAREHRRKNRASREARAHGPIGQFAEDHILLSQILVSLVVYLGTGAGSQVVDHMRTAVVSRQESFIVEGVNYSLSSCLPFEVPRKASAKGEYCKVSAAATNTTDRTSRPNATWTLVGADGEEFLPVPRFVRSPPLLPGEQGRVIVVFKIFRETVPTYALVVGKPRVLWLWFPPTFKVELSDRPLG